ncbi:MAG: ABC transporter substrate-binding protein, partial [Steroidobacteraceae bacterium]
MSVLLGAQCLAHAAHAPAQPQQAPAHVPSRVMSLSLCTDALVLDLLPPSRIVSVTYLARQSADPTLAAKAARVRLNYGEADEVMAAAPDLVLAGTYSTPGARAVLRKLAVPMLVVPPATSFAQIRRQVRHVARVLGVAPRGEALIAHMDTTLAALARTRPRPPIRVAGWNGDGFVPGQDSLFNTVLRAAGAVNIAAPPGPRPGNFSLEQVLLAHPQVLVYGSGLAAAALSTEAAHHPLLERLYPGRAITFPLLYAECGLPESADAVARVRRELL